MNNIKYIIFSIVKFDILSRFVYILSAQTYSENILRISVLMTYLGLRNYHNNVDISYKHFIIT
jgi:hypothetical protein